MYRVSLKKFSYSWEPKKFGTSYSETTHLLGLRFWIQGVLMRALCCRSFRSNRCLVSEYVVPRVGNFFRDNLYNKGFYSIYIYIKTIRYIITDSNSTTIFFD